MVSTWRSSWGSMEKLSAWPGPSPSTWQIRKKTLEDVGKSGWERYYQHRGMRKMFQRTMSVHTWRELGREKEMLGDKKTRSKEITSFASVTLGGGVVDFCQSKLWGTLTELWHHSTCSSKAYIKTERGGWRGAWRKKKARELIRNRAQSPLPRWSSMVWHKSWGMQQSSWPQSTATMKPAAVESNTHTHTLQEWELSELQPTKLLEGLDGIYFLCADFKAKSVEFWAIKCEMC